MFFLTLSRTLQPKRDHVTDLSAIIFIALIQLKQCAENVYISTHENINQ
jgi:hypothetical protein